MLHEPLRAVGRQSTLPHAVQHGGVSCMGVTNPSLALSGHARQFRAETLCSAKRGNGQHCHGQHFTRALLMSGAPSAHRTQHNLVKAARWHDGHGQHTGGGGAKALQAKTIN